MKYIISWNAPSSTGSRCLSFCTLASLGAHDVDWPPFLLSSSICYGIAAFLILQVRVRVIQPYDSAVLISQNTPVELEAARLGETQANAQPQVASIQDIANTPITFT
jgi:hypothetical protein